MARRSAGRLVVASTVARQHGDHHAWFVDPQGTAIRRAGTGGGTCAGLPPDAAEPGPAGRRVAARAAVGPGGRGADASTGRGGYRGARTAPLDTGAASVGDGAALAGGR